MKTEGSPTRAGRYITQLTGYKAFIPVPLPPDPPIAWDEELQNLLSKADMALGRLDGIATILPNPDLFVAMYVRKEAVLSSQIEGTRAQWMESRRSARWRLPDGLTQQWSLASENSITGQWERSPAMLHHAPTPPNWGSQNSAIALYLRFLSDMQMSLCPQSISSLQQ